MEDCSEAMVADVKGLNPSFVFTLEVLVFSQLILAFCDCYGGVSIK